MNMLELIVAVIGAALIVYLFVSIIKPELF
jgi:K+-transporting ATPase KdpF subunit